MILWFYERFCGEKKNLQKLEWLKNLRKDMGRVFISQGLQWVMLKKKKKKEKHNCIEFTWPEQIGHVNRNQE